MRDMLKVENSAIILARRRSLKTHSEYRALKITSRTSTCNEPFVSHVCGRRQCIVPSFIWLIKYLFLPKLHWIKMRGPLRMPRWNCVRSVRATQHSLLKSNAGDLCIFRIFLCSHVCCNCRISVDIQCAYFTKKNYWFCFVLSHVLNRGF